MLRILVDEKKCTGCGKCALVFITAQIFNIFVTLVLAYALFGGIFFPPPI